MRKDEEQLTTIESGPADIRFIEHLGHVKDAAKLKTANSDQSPHLFVTLLLLFNPTLILNLGQGRKSKPDLAANVRGY